MNQSAYFSLLEGAILVRKAADQLTITPVHSMNSWLSSITFKQVTDGLFDALSQAQKGPCSMAVLIGKVMQTDGLSGISKLSHYLKKLGDHGLLKYYLFIGETLYAAIQPLTANFRYEESKAQKDSQYVMSKFAYFYNNKGEMEVKSPLACGKISLHHPEAMTALYRLTKPGTAAELAEAVSGLDEDNALIFINFFANTSALQPCNGPDYAPEDNDPTLGQWAFHDLLFHTGSRLGRHADPYGGTFPFKDKFAPLPVVKEDMSDEIVPLHKPDLEKLKETDATFSQVLEMRQTIRKYGDEPIHVDQLGEFLYRAARIKKIHEEAGVSWRPSPGGGALHELEIYPVVNQCVGLPFGLYHYNPLKHHLARIRTSPEPLLHKLLEMGGMTGMLEQPPHVLLVLTARFQRVQIKYQSVAYSVILKNVGCLYQTMYMVAMAMHLAPCALGGGDSDLFAQIAGLNYYAETSVGEFLLGRPSIWPKPYQRPTSL